MTGIRPLPRAATSPASTSGLRTSSTTGADSSVEPSAPDACVFLILEPA